MTCNILTNAKIYDTLCTVLIVECIRHKINGGYYGDNYPKGKIPT